MNIVQGCATLGAFLATYWIHSTVVWLLAWGLAGRSRWLANPFAQIQLWKLTLVLPVATALASTWFPWPHFGMQLALSVPTARYHTSWTSSPSGAANGLALRTTTAGRQPVERPLQRGSQGSSFTDADQHFDAAERQSWGLPVSLRDPDGWDWKVALATSSSFVWMLVAVLGLGKLACQCRRLSQIRRNARTLEGTAGHGTLVRLGSRMGVRRRVALLASAEVHTPVAAGIASPCILIPFATAQSMPAEPERRQVAQSAPDPVDGGAGLGSQIEAMLAHELAHHRHGDPVWNLCSQLMCRTFFFQPLTRLASRELRRQMDFAADALAARTLGERGALIQCLMHFGELLCHRRPAEPTLYVLGSGMSLFQSTLGRRVEALLDADNNLEPPTRWRRWATILFFSLATGVLAVVAPRAVAEPSPAVAPAVFTDSATPRNSPMNKHVTSLVILSGLTMPVLAEEPASVGKPVAAPNKSAALNTTPDALPAGIRKFNGMLVGRIAAKDIEKGSFTVQVDAVPRVWKNSAAEDPRSIVGKTVEVGGVFGKFLDVLVVTRVGETVEFECKHDGERLVFPGELLRKVAPYDPADYPILPEAFRGFQGTVAAEVIKKDPETFELIIRIDRVLERGEANQAKDAKSIEGKSLMLAGFWNRREAYHDLKVGDRIEVGMRHIGLRSDHLTVAETVRKSGPKKDRAEIPSAGNSSRAEPSTAAEGQRGFRGSLVGRIVEKDVERGTLTITVDAVPRVWENNQAKAPKSLLGQNVALEGIAGRMLDALVVAKVGDTVELGAFHTDGPRMRVGEVLRKVAPVKPEDYPVLPDAFRGYRGTLIGKVVRKRTEWWEVILEVVDLGEPFPGNKAQDPRTVVGKQVMLAGFWNRKDDFHSLEVGDTVRCGVNHPQLLSDHLSVVEGIRKVDAK